MDTTEAVNAFEALMIGGAGAAGIDSPDGLKEKLLEGVTNGTVTKDKIPKPVSNGIEGRRWRRFADSLNLGEDDYTGITDWLEENYPGATEKFCEAPAVVTLPSNVLVLPAATTAPVGGGIDFSSISGPVLNDLEKCAAVQGMPSGELASFSFLVFTGSLPTGGDSLRPGEDPRMSMAYSRMRKTGMAMLANYMERESVQLLQMWFRGCQSYAADNGKPQMASAIAMFWSDTEAGFGDDVKLLVLYIEKYLAKYPGRGLPCSRDHKLFMDLKLIDSSTEMDGKKSKAAKKSESSEEMKELKEMVLDLKAANQRLERQHERSLDHGYREGGERTPDTRECNYCGKKGHLKATCRDRIKAEKKAKKLKEESGVEEETE